MAEEEEGMQVLQAPSLGRIFASTSCLILHEIAVLCVFEEINLEIEIKNELAAKHHGM